MALSNYSSANDSLKRNNQLNNSHLSTNVHKAHFVVRILYIVCRTTAKDTFYRSLKVADWIISVCDGTASRF